MNSRIVSLLSYLPRGWFVRVFQASVAVALLGLAPAAFAGPGISLSVSPTAIAWDTNTWVNLDITGLTLGQPVDLVLYADINRNGTVEAIDKPIMRFRVQDGVTNSLGSQVVVCDTDGVVDRAIHARVSYHGLDGFAQVLHAVGKYVWQAAPTNGSAPAVRVFSVSQPVGTACITGSVQSLTGLDPIAGTPLPGALVTPEYYSMRQGFVPATWSDTNGDFVLYVPACVSNDNVSWVSAVGFGYFMAVEGRDPGTFISGIKLQTILHAGTNSLPQPLYVVPSMPSEEVYSISGYVYDENTNALAGILVNVEPDESDAFSMAMTDSNGAFTVPMPDMGGDQVFAYCSDSGLNMRGLVGAAVGVGSVSGDVSGIEIYLPRATTLVKGSVRKAGGSGGVMGAYVSVSTDTIGSESYAFDSEGRFEIGMIGGTGFEADIENDSVLPLRRICRGQSGIELPSSGEWTNLTFEAEPGWVVSGHVYDQATNALSGGGVTASYEGQRFDDTEANLDGYYELLVPVNDGYQIGTEDYSDIGYVDQTLPDPVTVVSSDVGGVDIYLAQAAVISGRLMGDGLPLENVDVQAGLLITNEWGNLQWQHVRTQWTDANGEYSLFVAPGVAYCIGVALDQSFVYPWLGQYYTDTRDVTEATLVTALVGAPVTNINFTLHEAAHISGRVMGGGVPLPDTGVQAVILTRNGWGGWDWNGVDYRRTDSYGNYTLTVPPGVEYAVFTDGPDGGSWLRQFYSNVSDQAEATLVTPTAEAPATDIDFNLQQGAIISGQVIAGGDPVPNAGVAAALPFPAPWGGTNWMNVKNDQTDSEGNYAMTVPPGVEYLVVVNPPNGSLWLKQFFSNSLDEAHATLVTPLVDAPATNIDFVLQRGAIISGRVLGGGGPVENVDVQAGLVSQDEWDNWRWQHVSSVNTDSNGEYSIVVSPGVTYCVGAALDRNRAPMWLDQFYSNALYISGSALLVTPLADAPATNINFALTPAMRIEGWVLDATNQPIRGMSDEPMNVNVQVGACDGSGNWGLRWETWSDWDGHYSIKREANSNHIVRVSIGGYQEVYFHDKLSATNAEIVSAGQGQIVSNVNFRIYDPMADSDGDSFPDYIEGYVTGTNPFDSNDVLRCASLQFSNTHVSVSWAAVSNKAYTLQRTTDLLDPSAWSNVTPQPVMVDGSNATFTDSNAPASSSYRLLMTY